MNPAHGAPATNEARNKAVIERYFHEVLDRRNFALMPELIAADAVLHRPGFDVIGLEAAMQRLRATLADYTAFESELSGMIAEGDMVAVRIRHRTRVRPHLFRNRAGEVAVAAEQELSWSASVQFRLRDGKIAEEWVMRDELGMLMQLGTVTLGRKV